MMVKLMACKLVVSLELEKAILVQLKMWKPMKEPKPWDATYNVAAYTALTNLTNLTATLDLVSTFETLGCALLADIYRGWVWDMYQRTQDLKDKSRNA